MKFRSLLVLVLGTCFAIWNHFAMAQATAEKPVNVFIVQSVDADTGKTIERAFQDKDQTEMHAKQQRETVQSISVDKNGAIKNSSQFKNVKVVQKSMSAADSAAQQSFDDGAYDVLGSGNGSNSRIGNSGKSKKPRKSPVGAVNDKNSSSKSNSTNNPGFEPEVTGVSRNPDGSRKTNDDPGYTVTIQKRDKNGKWVTEVKTFKLGEYTKANRELLKHQGPDSKATLEHIKANSQEPRKHSTSIVAPMPTQGAKTSVADTKRSNSGLSSSSTLARQRQSSGQ